MVVEDGCLGVPQLGYHVAVMMKVQLLDCTHKHGTRVGGDNKLGWRGGYRFYPFHNIYSCR